MRDDLDDDIGSKEGRRRTISSVCCARFSKLVYATSIVIPSRHIDVAPAAASFLPNVVSSTSAHPVKRLASFHTDCPCRRKITLACSSAMKGDAWRVRLPTDIGRSWYAPVGAQIRSGSISVQV